MNLYQMEEHLRICDDHSPVDGTAGSEKSGRQDQQKTGCGAAGAGDEKRETG
jgi:hypothetical protein